MASSRGLFRNLPHLPTLKKLNIPKVLLGAVLIPWHQRRVFARALAVPMALYVALVFAWQLTDESLPVWFKWVAWAGHMGLFVVIAVACHRIVLLAPQPASGWYMPAWTRRELLFAFWFVLVWFAVWIIVTLPVSMVTSFLLSLAGWTGIFETDKRHYFEYAISIVYWYYIARMSLLFPAIAIDAPFNFVDAWRQSRGNGWRLFVVVGAMPYCLSHAAGLLWREGATHVEMILLGALGVVLLAIEIAAISISYRELVENVSAHQH